MKKHVMVLDFTSLLDVILIILFLVLCTMNGKAQKDAAAIESLEADKAAYEALTAEQRDEIDSLTEKNTELDETLTKTTEDLTELNKKYTEASAESDYYRVQAENAQENLKKYMEIGGMSDTDRIAFERFKENSAVFKITLEAVEVKDYSKGHILVVYKGDNQIGNPLRIYVSKLADSQSENETVANIKSWINQIFKGQQSSLRNKDVFIILRYDNEKVYLRTPPLVERALKSIDTLSDIGYDLVVDIK